MPQGTVVGHVFLVTDKDNQLILVVRATAEGGDAIIDGKSRPAAFGSGNVIMTWDVRSGQRLRSPLAVPADVTDFRVAALDGSDDLLGWEFGDEGSLQVWNLDHRRGHHAPAEDRRAGDPVGIQP